MRLANWPSGLQHINRPKYRNIPTCVDGKRFDSKLEARRYEQLKLLQVAGEVKWFIRQPSFDLPGGIVYRADFLVCRRIGTPWSSQGKEYPSVQERVVVEDVKGVETKDFKLKMRLFKETYPQVDLQILKKADIG